MKKKCIDINENLFSSLDMAQFSGIMCLDHNAVAFFINDRVTYDDFRPMFQKNSALHFNIPCRLSSRTLPPHLD